MASRFVPPGRGYRHAAHSVAQQVGARYVTLGNGRRVGLASYVAAWRACLAADPAQPIRMDLHGLPGSTAADVLRQFRDGLHDRINRHIPGYGVGRKWSPDWQREAIHFAAQVNTPRLVVRYLPKDFRGLRFMHRLPD